MKGALNYVKIINLKVIVKKCDEHYYQNNFSNEYVKRGLYRRNKIINRNADEITGASREGIEQSIRQK